LKEETPFLRSLYSSPIKNTALRLSTAIREYQKSRHGERGNGHKVEWPKFRSWKKKWFSLCHDEPWKGYSLAACRREKFTRIFFGFRRAVAVH
jgi:putative transposase